MTSNRDLFITYEKLEKPVSVIIGDATELKGIGVGDINLQGFNGKEYYEIVLKDVLHTPKMPFNLFSVSKMLDKGYIQMSDAVQSIFKTADGSEIVSVAVRDGDLFRMVFKEDRKSSSRINSESKLQIEENFKKSNSCLIAKSLKIWHEKLAHQNIKQVREILDRNNIKYINDWENYVCAGCVFGKQHRVSHPENLKVAKQTLDIIHVDLCEMNIKSLGGAKYFLLFKDDFSHFKTVYFLKTKDEAVKCLKNFMTMIENQFERKVKFLMSDNGTEIKNAACKEILDEIGIFHMKSCAYTPQQNGRIEREIRTVSEAARSVIHQKDMKENLWAEAVNYVVFTLNQTGTSSEKGKTPADLWFGRKIDINKLKMFGSKCYVFIEDHKRAKSQKKAQEGICWI